MTTLSGPKEDRQAHGGTPARGRWDAGTSPAYVTTRFDALGHAFAVLTDDAALGRHLDRVLASLAAPAEPEAMYRLTSTGEAVDHYELSFGDEVLLRTASAARALGHLIWHINRCAVERGSSHSVLVHAAGASRRGVGVVLPAPMECGKTTLVAGLVRAGFAYLTDEAVAVDSDTLTLRPYPKPLSIDPGSWRVLPELRPQVEAGVERYLSRQWQVPPDGIRPGAVSGPVPPRLVVSPRYEAEATTTLEPVRRAEMVRMLAEQTFHLHDAGRRNLTVLAELVRRCDCYRLTVGDLDRACELLIELTETVDAGGEGRD